MMASPSDKGINVVPPPKLKTGFVETVHFSKPIKCRNEGCRVGVSYGGKVYYDTENEMAAYCYICGPVKRYERKKEQERSEKNASQEG